MKPPKEAIISPEKIRNYLLVSRKKGDKSKWLASAGYERQNWKVLEKDLLKLLQTSAIYRIKDGPYGITHEMEGQIMGPNGKVLSVCSVWLTEHETGQTKFITAFPQRRKKT
jgi:hypothetical protein